MVDLAEKEGARAPYRRKGTDSDENRALLEAADRLKMAVEAGGGPGRVSVVSGVPSRTLGNYLAGGGMKAVNLGPLADACGVRIEWLATGRGPMKGSSSIDQETIDLIAGKGPASTRGRDSQGSVPPNFIRLPLYDARAAAGAGEEVVSETVSGHLAFSTNWISTHLRRRPDNLVVIAAVGVSMSPTIGDGDIMVVDTSVLEPKSDGIYVLSVGGALLVKRVQIRLDGSYTVSGDNPAYSAETFHPSEESRMRVVGQVLWHGGMVR